MVTFSQLQKPSGSVQTGLDPNLLALLKQQQGGSSGGGLGDLLGQIDPQQVSSFLGSLGGQSGDGTTPVAPGEIVTGPPAPGTTYGPPAPMGRVKPDRKPLLTNFGEQGKQDQKQDQNMGYEDPNKKKKNGPVAETGEILSNAMTGAGLGSFGGPVGTIIGALLGAIKGFVT